MGILITAAQPLTATQLVALATPLGLSATNVKSHLSRMVSQGMLQRDGPARLATYWPAKAQSEFIKSLRDRMRMAPEEPWDSSWLTLILNLPQNRSARDNLRASLWFSGFRPVETSVYVRPAWPLPWAEKEARQYSVRWAGLCVRGLIVAAFKSLGLLYDLDGLNAQAQALASRIRKIKVSSIASREAFALRIRIGAQAVQLIGHDPRLPAAIWGTRQGMRRLVEEFANFEENISKSASAFVQQVISRGDRQGQLRGDHGR
jgi:phenylacetic acid degradation operon negative regulatory protein